ncbi:MAG: cytochrome c [Gammaproteobacteria bacterium]|nr:cytochrome c [Gammaproteobacteria bacterium]
MKAVSIVLLSLVVLSVSAEEKSRGQAIFDTLCFACHKFDHGPNMIAPPVYGVKNHYIRVYPGRDEFVKQVSYWLENQDSSRTLMPGAVRRFGLMPPISLSASDRKAVAGFVYDAEFSEPSWYAEHYQMEHGSK